MKSFSIIMITRTSIIEISNQPIPMNETETGDADENSQQQTDPIPKVSYWEVLDALEKLRLYRSQEPHLNTRRAELFNEVLYWEKRDVEMRRTAARTSRPQQLITTFFQSEEQLL